MSCVATCLLQGLVSLLHLKSTAPAPRESNCDSLFHVSSSEDREQRVGFASQVNKAAVGEFVDEYVVLLQDCIESHAGGALLLLPVSPVSVQRPMHMHFHSLGFS
jgi:hypothetical protein